MSAAPVDVSGVRTLTTLLRQLPTGEAAALLASRLGVWTEAAHVSPEGNKGGYPKEFSSLTDHKLSDVNAQWLSEAGRATELVGMLDGQKTMVALLCKQARASARARIRRQWEAEALPEGAKPVKRTVGELNDAAEDDNGVQESDLRAALLDQAMSSAKAYKEACLMMVAGISREISFRQAQYGARLR